MKITNNISKQVIIFLTLCIIFSSFPVLALSVEKELDDYVVTSIEDNIITHKITSQNIKALSNTLQSKRIARNSTEVQAEVLKYFGYTEADIEVLGNEFISEFFADGAEITMTETYVKKFSNDTQVIIDKNVCLNEANIFEQNQINNFISDFENHQLYFDSEISENESYFQNNEIAIQPFYSDNTVISGYMRITTTSMVNYKTEIGWCRFYSTFEWLSTPSDRKNDGISIFVDSVAWSQNATELTSNMSYTEMIYFNGTTHTFPINQSGYVTVQPDGIFATYKLPEASTASDYSSMVIQSNFIFSIKGTARIRNHTLPCSFNVHSKYVHLKSYFVVEPSFDWTIGPNFPGISLSGGLSVKSDTYFGHNYTNYDPNLRDM